MQDSFRRSTITLPLPGSPLAAANGVCTYVPPRPMRIAGAQLCLSDTGTGSGATNVNVKVNGTAINGANTLSIAGAAGTKQVGTGISAGTNNYPGGARVNKGDTITVDIASVPATTQPKGGFVVLDVVEVDV